MSRWCHTLRLAAGLGQVGASAIIEMIEVIEMTAAGTSTRCSPFCLLRNRGHPKNLGASWA